MNHRFDRHSLFTVVQIVSISRLCDHESNEEIVFRFEALDSLIFPKRYICHHDTDAMERTNSYGYGSINFIRLDSRQKTVKNFEQRQKFNRQNRLILYKMLLYELRLSLTWNVKLLVK